MLSPGQWHEQVPKDLGANIRWRQAMLGRARKDRNLQRAIRLACSQDILFYVNGFLYQYNPNSDKRPGHELGPFITWGFQDEAIRTALECIENGRDLCVEKSREMGASWLLLIIAEWMWHFHPWKKMLCISRNADAVDADDPDSLFWKIDFMHSYQPKWLLPRGYESKPPYRKEMLFKNPENQSVITGQASTGKAGVGGRATWMLVDEFGQIREDYEVLHRTADTTSTRIFNSTHTAIDNAFAEISRRADMKKLRLLWYMHPQKNHGLYRYDPEAKRLEIIDKQYEFPPDYRFILDGKLRGVWYDAECARRNSDRAVAMDLDADARGSMSQFFNGLMIQQLKASYCTAPLWEGDLDYDPDTGKPVELIRREGGLIKLWLQPNARGGVPEGRYAFGADLSTGMGATNSCLSAIDCVTGEKVLEVATPHMRPEQMASLAVALCWLFKDSFGEGARIAWEQQGPGEMFAKQLLENLGYRNVYVREHRLPHTLTTKVSDRPGWVSNPATKLLLLEDYKSGLLTRQCVNRSEEALDECLSFRYLPNGNVEHGNEASRNDPTGARYNHGDRVIADALAWMLAKGQRSVARQKEQADEEKVGSLAWRRKIRENQARQEAWA